MSPGPTQTHPQGRPPPGLISTLPAALSSKAHSPYRSRPRFPLSALGHALHFRRTSPEPSRLNGYVDRYQRAGSILTPHSPKTCQGFSIGFAGESPGTTNRPRRSRSLAGSYGNPGRLDVPSRPCIAGQHLPFVSQGQGVNMNKQCIYHLRQRCTLISTLLYSHSRCKSCLPFSF